MDEMLAYCGLNCDDCLIYLATRQQDGRKRDEMRVQIKKEIAEHYGPEKVPETIGDCDGCKTENGRLFCNNNCQIRTCAIQKKIENCAHCEDYPCEKLNKFFEIEPHAKNKLEQTKNKR